MLHDCQTFLFDLDGTLVTSALDFPAMKAAVMELAAQRGVPEAELAALDILAAVDAAADCLGVAGTGFRVEADALLAQWEVAGARENEEIPGSAAALAELRARGRQVGIVTRNCRAAVAETLRRVPLPHDVLLTRNDVPRAKPDPAHLARAIEELQARPETSVMVGDHWMDVQAGRRAGMRTVGVGSAPATRFAPMPPDGVAATVADMVARYVTNGEI